MTLAVREERPGDEEAVHAVHAAAFGREAEAALVDDLRAAGAVVHSYLAEDGGTVTAHALLSRIDVGGEPALALAPVGVLPDRQGHGEGSMVVRAALSAATAAGERLVLVLGDPAYYRRFGFRPAAEHGVEPPDGWPAPAFQALLLGGAPPTGPARYPEPFRKLPD